MKIQLQCVDAFPAMPPAWIEEFPAQLGRGAEANLSIKDIWASRLHCELNVQDGCLTARDLDSRNGTYLNGERMTCARLTPGDRLTVGITTFVVLFDPAEVTADSSSAEIPALSHTVAC